MRHRQLVTLLMPALILLGQVVVLCLPLPGAHLPAWFLLVWAADQLMDQLLPILPLHKRQVLLFLFLLLPVAIPCGSPAAASTGPFRFLAVLIAGIMALALPLLSVPFSRSSATSWRRGRPRRPDPARPLILVADPHWSTELTGLEAATAAHPEADWLFLGDVFEVWVGLPGMETPAQEAFLAWVDGRRRAGRWVGLWMGNREYFLERHARRFDLLGAGLGGELPAERLAFEHGDLVNAGDWRYRLWNVLSRSAPVWLAVWLLAHLLPRRARALAGRLERALRGTNRDQKLHFPEADFRALAIRTPRNWTLVMGHFHGEAREGRALALPWAHEGAFQVWRDGMIAPLQIGFNNSHECDIHTP